MNQIKWDEPTEQDNICPRCLYNDVRRWPVTKEAIISRDRILDQLEDKLARC